METIPTLSFEVLDRIVALLDIRTLAAFAQTSRACYQLTRRYWAAPRCEAASTVLKTGEDEPREALRRLCAEITSTGIVPDVVLVLYYVRHLPLQDVQQEVRQHFPAKTKLLGCCSSGIIGFERSTKAAHEWNDGEDAISIMAIRLPGATIDCAVAANRKQAEHALAAMRQVDVPTVSLFAGSITSIPKSENLLRMLEKSLIPYGVITGGYCGLGRGLGYDLGMFTAESVSASSAAGWLNIGSDYTTAVVVGVRENDVLAELSNVKTRYPSVQFLFAFMVVCNGRGMHRYDVADYETSALHEVFPGLPVCGFFSGGEFGPSLMTCRVGRPAAKTRSFTFTTFFTLVGIRAPDSQ